MRFLSMFRREFWVADDETGERLARVDRDISTPRDACVTDVHPTPYRPVTVRSIPNVAWPDAWPEWEDLTPTDIDDHRTICPDTCQVCEAHRQWGYCPGCGHGNAEAIDGITVCCKTDVTFGPAAERAWVS